MRHVTLSRRSQVRVHPFLPFFSLFFTRAMVRRQWSSVATLRERKKESVEVALEGEGESWSWTRWTTHSTAWREQSRLTSVWIDRSCFEEKKACSQTCIPFVSVQSLCCARSSRSSGILHTGFKHYTSKVWVKIGGSPINSVFLAIKAGKENKHRVIHS